MARIIYSGIVTKISGSMGGTTFQSNAYGYTCKNKANMVKPNSEDQQLRKLILASATKNWSSMAQLGRDNWNTFAATFPQYSKHNTSAVLSGFAVFVKWHAAFYLGTGTFSFVDSAPTVAPSVMDTVVVTITNLAGVLTLHTAWAIGDESWNVNFFISRQFSKAQNFVGSSPRFIRMGTSTVESVPITALYLAKFGTIPPIGAIVNVNIQMFEESGGKVLATSTQRVTIT